MSSRQRAYSQSNEGTDRKVWVESGYIPDIAFSNYHMFPTLKKHLGGSKFATDEEI